MDTVGAPIAIKYSSIIMIQPVFCAPLLGIVDTTGAPIAIDYSSIIMKRPVFRFLMHTAGGPVAIKDPRIVMIRPVFCFLMDTVRPTNASNPSLFVTPASTSRSSQSTLAATSDPDTSRILDGLDRIIPIHGPNGTKACKHCSTFHFPPNTRREQDNEEVPSLWVPLACTIVDRRKRMKMSKTGLSFRQWGDLHNGR